VVADFADLAGHLLGVGVAAALFEQGACGIYRVGGFLDLGQAGLLLVALQQPVQAGDGDGGNQKCQQDHETEAQAKLARDGQVGEKAGDHV